MKKLTLLSILNCFLLTITSAQSTTMERFSSFEKMKATESPIATIPFRNIGPTVMSGRVTDIEVNPTNPNEMYVAYASGGVWYSINNGQSFEPIFDGEATHTIGDMAMDWKTNTLWVGTGEVNASRSSYAGTGVYKTNNKGKTWHYMGLEESHHIGKIELNSAHPSQACVAVLGHLYSYNKERGIYKTTDGGLTWKQTLYINDSTGCVDLIQDPKNSDILYATSWTRTRTPWNFNGMGKASGIYKSIDGGTTWTLLSTATSGFPTGEGVGRIGLSISNSNTLYALLDNNFNQEKKEDKEDAKLNALKIERMNETAFLKLDAKQIDDYLKSNGYPKQYTAENVKESIRQKKYSVKDLAEWKLADADANLFNTPIKGAEVFRSNDAGLTWHKTHSKNLDGMYFTYGYYFGTITVSQSNPDKLMIGGYPLLLSKDGGQTFEQIDGENSHPDYHRIWMNPQNDRHSIACNDGGLNISYDDGQHWYKANSPAVGQFYAIEVDNAKPYNVYGGLQDNGTWVGPSSHSESTGWHQSGKYAYTELGGGDGMQVQVDTRNNSTIYLGYQFGNYWRMDKNSNDETTIKPVHEIGQKPFRFNWQTPIYLSKHNQDIFYMGSNCFHRSMNQGEELKTLSGDLTSTQKKGNVPYGTATSIHESPSRFGLVYIGTDDGNIHMSQDAGFSWRKISNTLPPNLWVSRVLASKHHEARVYATLNGYRHDDFNPYAYRSEDYGQTWSSISAQLPKEPINIIREDPKNPNIIYIGTDNGLYVSFDQGNTYINWNGNLPRVAIHDMAIQERENDLILGTHGRSIYIANLDLIQQYAHVKSEPFAMFDLQPKTWSSRLGSKYASYAKPTQDSLSISFFTQVKGKFTISILNETNQLMNQFDYMATMGINTAKYNLSMDEVAITSLPQKSTQADDGHTYLPAGKYTIQLLHPNGTKKSKEFELKEKK